MIAFHVAVAENYVEKYLTNKIDILNKILDCPPSTSYLHELNIFQPIKLINSD